MELYSEEDKNTMRTAEHARLAGKNRIEELKNYARLKGIKRIGIANCVALQTETDKLVKMLENEFEVYHINCFTGKITTSELLGINAKGISCNPAGQAKYLKENNTELNIMVGLCMGHDIIFNQKSDAPVTTLIVKDREFKHNPMLAFKEGEAEF